MFLLTKEDCLSARCTYMYNSVMNGDDCNTASHVRLLYRDTSHNNCIFYVPVSTTANQMTFVMVKLSLKIVSFHVF